MLAAGIRMRTRTWGSAVMLLVAVAGVVSGLLAMHVMSTPGAPSHSYSATDAAHGSSTPAEFTAPMPAGPTASPGCAGDGCDPMHDMTAMVCTLALLAATLLLVAPAIGRALLDLSPRGTPWALFAVASHPAGAPPPSRLALSVDRK